MAVIEIWTAEDLANIKYDMTADYVQMADIDLSDWGEWDPIDGESAPWYFMGTYDGNNHTISNMTITEYKYYRGLFAMFNLESAETTVIIKNLNIINSSITVSEQSQKIGLLCGFAGRPWGGTAPGTLTIENVHVEGNILVDPASFYVWDVGGLIGQIAVDHTTLKKCSANVNLSGSENVGGLVGMFGAGLIENCYSRGTIIVNYSPGQGWYDYNCGFIGYSYASIINNCYAAVTIDTSAVEPHVGESVRLEDNHPFTYVYVEEGYEYWNIETFNCYYDINLCDLPDNGFAIPRTTQEMTYPENFETTYSTWDFVTVWKSDIDYINAGYPIFAYGLIVLVNSHQVEFDEVEPYIDGDNIMIPMSKVIRKMGGKVYWDEENYIATAIMDGTIIEFFVNTSNVYVNGVLHVLDYIIPIEGDRTILKAEDINRFFSRWELDLTNFVHYYSGGIYVKKTNWIQIPIKNYDNSLPEEEEI